MIKKVKSSRFAPLLTVIFLLLWTLVSTFLPQLLIAIIFLPFEQKFPDSAFLTTLENLLSYSSTLFLLIFVPYKLFKKLPPSREDLGLKNLPTFIDIGLAPVGFLVYYFLSTLLTSLFSLFPWFNLGEVQDVGFNQILNSSDFIFTFLTLVIIAPIAEELIFRGWLYGKLREKIPKKLSIPLSILLVSILFGLLHGQWNVGVNVFALSVVLCLMREVTGTIYSGIFLHILKNTLAFCLIYVLHLA